MNNIAIDVSNSSHDTPYGGNSPLTREETESIRSYLRHHPRIVVISVVSLVSMVIAAVANIVTLRIENK